MDSMHLARPDWRSHLRAIIAIARKDWLHFLRYPLNAVFRVIQPLMWLTPIYFLGKSFATTGGNTGFAAYSGTADYMSFILVGAVLSSYISSVFWGMGFALKSDMDAGVLETNWMVPLPRPLFLVGQTIASIAITTLTSVGLLLLGWLFFGFNAGGNLVAAVLVVLPMLIALYGFGFAFAAIVLIMREANTMVDISDYLISLLSGTVFPVQVLPRFLLPVALALPLTYGIDAFRGYLLGTATLLPIRYEIAILVAFMGVLVVLGYAVFKLIERRCKTLGTIGTH
jgi:ABC-2 type transport system permease protein